MAPTATADDEDNDEGGGQSCGTEVSEVGVVVDVAAAALAAL